MANTIHIPMTEEEKDLIKKAAAIEKLKHTTFLRRTTLLEAEKIIRNKEVNSN